PVYQRPRITAWHVPYCDEQHPVRIAGLEHRDDVRIIHRRRRPGLADETMPEGLIRRQCRSQDLERYRPLKPHIQSAEHNRHPALADLLLQTVPGDPRTSRQAGQEPEGSGLLIAHHTSRTRKPSSASSPPSGIAGADRSATSWRVSMHPGPCCRVQQGDQQRRLACLQPRTPRAAPARWQHDISVPGASGSPIGGIKEYGWTKSVTDNPLAVTDRGPGADYLGREPGSQS